MVKSLLSLIISFTPASLALVAPSVRMLCFQTKWINKINWWKENMEGEKGRGLIKKENINFGNKTKYLMEQQGNIQHKKTIITQITPLCSTIFWHCGDRSSAFRNRVWSDVCWHRSMLYKRCVYYSVSAVRLLYT